MVFSTTLRSAFLALLAFIIASNTIFAQDYNTCEPNLEYEGLAPHPGLAWFYSIEDSYLINFRTIH
jgi:hypothetical protein